MDNVYKNEKTLFKIAFVFSLLFWLALVIGTIGIALIYLLIGFIVYLFIQSGFISYIKGTAVRVSAEQYPELYKQYMECNQKLGLEQVPEIYILNSDGILNALATRFLKKTYVILYSDVIDALSSHERSLNFYIGHELGHIKQGHLKWSPFLWPAMVIPLLGTAYHRAREYSCDLHGLACCDSPLDSAYGLSVLAAGPVKWSKISLKKYAQQTEDTGSFWMSYHELVNDYPWLCKRVNHVMSNNATVYTNPPKRNLFAWILALFTPRVGGGLGGGAGIIVLVAVIGILAAVAIPQYQMFIAKSNVNQAVTLGNQITLQMTPYIIEKRQLPNDLTAIGVNNDISNQFVSSVRVSDIGLELTLSASVSQLAGQTIVFQPYLDDNENINWDCSRGTLAPKYLPPQCH